MSSFQAQIATALSAVFSAAPLRASSCPKAVRSPYAKTSGNKAFFLRWRRQAITRPSPIRASPPTSSLGHGVLGRLIARIVIASGAPAPTVWEKNASRFAGAAGYQVIDPDQDPRRDYRVICDVSGDSSILDALVSRLAPGGEIVLAGFYADRLSFSFPPAFMKEARMRVAAQWQKADMLAVKQLVDSGRLSFDGLITHRSTADGAPSAYRVAFEDPACLKMVLDWRKCV